MFPEEKEKSRAERQALNWLTKIEEAMCQLAAAQDSYRLRSETSDETQDAEKIDLLVSALQNDVLSLRVRSDWHDPSGESGSPFEFEILLSWGGPSVRLYGILSEYMEPMEVWIEHQDWGLPWRRLPATPDVRAKLLQYSKLFWFGD